MWKEIIDGLFMDFAKTAKVVTSWHQKWFIQCLEVLLKKIHSRWYESLLVGVDKISTFYDFFALALKFNLSTLWDVKLYTHVSETSKKLQFQSRTR